MTCPNCGANVVNNTMARCPYCGAELGYPSGGYAQGTPQSADGSLRGKMIASMVLGISSAAVAWYSWFSALALAAGIVGLVLSMQVKKAAPAGMPLGMATAGFICSIVGIALSGIFFLRWLF